MTGAAHLTAAEPGMADLASRADIVRLVDAFYSRVRSDARLGPIFDDVAQVDWDRHLPRMYDFWDSVLFGRAVFTGNPPAVHRELARRTPLSGAAFARWLELFDDAVDSLFRGPRAEDTKARAARIAQVLQAHVDADRA